MQRIQQKVGLEEVEPPDDDDAVASVREPVAAGSR
jgi:hypothetical protein